MNTDAAEAILLGHFAVNEKLGWNREKPDAKRTAQPCCSQEQLSVFKPPLVERYTNGNVVLPKEKKVG
jgi:hypothetical protein